jgi:hypothetical protein
MRVLFEHPDCQIVEYAPAVRSVCRLHPNQSGWPLELPRRESKIGQRSKYIKRNYEYPPDAFEPVKFPYMLFARNGRSLEHYLGIALLTEPFTSLSQKCFLGHCICLDHYYGVSCKLDIKELIKYFWQSPSFFAMHTDDKGGKSINLSYYKYSWNPTCSTALERMIGLQNLKLFKKALEKKAKEVG